MAWKGISVDRLIAKLTGGKIGHESKSFYTNFYGNLDFEDDDLPNWRAVKALFGAYGAGLPVPFTAVSTVTITWQTDIPPGQTATYAAIFGNMYPKPYVFDDSDIKQDFTLTANRVTPGDITTDLTTVVFDFPQAMTGTIQF